MKITEVTPITEYIVETDNPNYPTYRTDGKGNWENQMGDSWEAVYATKELDELLWAWQMNNDTLQAITNA